MMVRRTPKRAGFSMIELLVVLAVLGFLLALLLPAIQKVREAAARAQTQNNLKQMALALHHCHDAHKRMPPAFGKFAGLNSSHSIHIYLLPFLEQANLYNQYAQGPGNVPEVVIPPFVSPADPSRPEPPAGIQNAAANLRAFSAKGLRTRWDAPLPALGQEEPGKARFADFTDGLSNTIIFGTRYGVCGEGGSRYAAAPNANTAALFGQNPAKVAARPANLTATFLLHPAADQCQPTPLMGHAFSGSGMDVALGDGSVRHVSARVSPRTWNLALCPNDGQVLGADW
jgi:prepilin-type N-terminal cleavage/methylation domain-containing protein